MKTQLLALAVALGLASSAAAQTTPIYSNIRFLKTDDGSATLPSMTFTLNPNTGLYRIGANDIGISTNGVKRIDFNTARMLIASGYAIQVGANTLTTSDLLDATKLSGIVPSVNGGSGNAFFGVSGPTTSLKNFTFPNASATVLTDNAPVTTAQGGFGASTTATSGRYPKGNGSTWATSSGSASGTGACSAHQWASTLNSDAAPTCTQPASADLSDTANVPLLNATNGFTGREDFTQYTEKKTAPSISSNVLTINLQSGTFFAVSMNANVTTLTLSNAPSTGTTGSVVLVLTQDGTGGRTVTWPAAVKWPSGTAPTLSAANKTDIITLVTFDAGTTYYGFVSGQAY